MYLEVRITATPALNPTSGSQIKSPGVALPTYLLPWSLLSRTRTRAAGPQGYPCVESLPIDAGNPYPASPDRVSTAYQFVVHIFASRPSSSHFGLSNGPVFVPQCLCATRDYCTLPAGLSVPLDNLVLFAASKVVVYPCLPVSELIGLGFLMCRLTGYVAREDACLGLMSHDVSVGSTHRSHKIR